MSKKFLRFEGEKGEPATGRSEKGEPGPPGPQGIPGLPGLRGDKGGLHFSEVRIKRFMKSNRLLYLEFSNTFFYCCPIPVATIELYKTHSSNK